MKPLDKKYNFLKPIKISDLVRLGREAEGGYIVSKEIARNCNSLISFGMGPDWSFELDFIKINPKIKIYMYDYTVNIKPYVKEVWKYFRRFITFRGKFDYLSIRMGYLNKYLDFFKLKNINFFPERITSKIINKIDSDIDKVFSRLESNEEVILKSDIEGSEFEIIDGIAKYSERIKMLVFEFHWLDRNEKVFLDSVKKLQKYFEIIHIHGNNHCKKLDTGLPITLEMTLINKKYTPTVKEFNTNFPLKNLDYSNNPYKEDLIFHFED